MPEVRPPSSATQGATQPNTAVQTGAVVRTYMLAIAADSGPRLLAFRAANLLIGRLADNHLALNHGSVSRRHARISVTPTGVVIEDLGSQNGTTVNGVTVVGVQPIRPGDVLRVGYVPMFYFGFVQPETPPTVEVVKEGVAIIPMAPPI